VWENTPKRKYNRLTCGWKRVITLPRSQKMVGGFM